MAQQYHYRNGRKYRRHRGKWGSKGAIYHSNKRGTISKILRDYSEEVQQAAVDALNRNAVMLQGDIKGSMDTAGIKRDTGKLEESVKVGKATLKNLDATVVSEVYKPLPDNPGSRNPNVYYPSKGVPYGRLLEFSPRINKPFFYDTFYVLKKMIIDDVFESVRKAGN